MSPPSKQQFVAIVSVSYNLLCGTDDVARGARANLLRWGHSLDSDVVVGFIREASGRGPAPQRDHWVRVEALDVEPAKGIVAGNASRPIS